MPIKKENRHHYTGAAGWPAVRARIMKRSQALSHEPEKSYGLCELCSAPNNRVIYRQPFGPMWTVCARDGWKPVKVVITIAHINQDPSDNRDINLLALCQRCHNRIDAPYRQINAAKTRAAKRGQKC